MQHPLINWIPYKLISGRDATLVKWLCTGDKKYTEPFFDETILCCKKLPENSSPFSSASGLNWLTEAAEKVESLPPDGLIFHVSRCGSTLLAQLLGIKPDAVVLAEVPLLDEILRLKEPIFGAPEQKKELFAATVKLLAQKRTGYEKHLFLKLDSWHLFYYDLLRELYPDVPFFFMYRNPAEVINSHRKLRGIHMVPGLVDTALFGLETETPVYCNLDIFAARVLESYFKKLLSVVAKNDAHNYFLNYNSGTAFLTNFVAEKTRTSFSEDELQEIKQRSNFHSKFPGQVFAGEKTCEQHPEEMKELMALYYTLDLENKQKPKEPKSTTAAVNLNG